MKNLMEPGVSDMNFYNSFNEMYNNQSVGVSDVGVFNEMQDRDGGILINMSDKQIKFIQQFDEDFEFGTTLVCVHYFSPESIHEEGILPGEDRRVSYPETENGYALLNFNGNKYTKYLFSDKEIDFLLSRILGKKDYTKKTYDGYYVFFGSECLTDEEADKLASSIEQRLNQFVNDTRLENGRNITRLK